MKPRNYMMAVAMLCLCLLGCHGNIELVGYGVPMPVQDGLEVRLINDGKDGAFFYVKNASDQFISVNQSPLAARISVRANGLAVSPVERIMIDMDMNPKPDDFVILAPGQTRTIPIPVSYEGDRYRAFDVIYSIKKGTLYEVEVQIDPYFGTFNQETAQKTLADFQIPNYRLKAIKANTMTIRSR